MHFFNLIFAYVLATSLTINALPQQAGGRPNETMDSVGEKVRPIHERLHLQRLTSL
jgi:hypothetical protein